MTVRWIFIDGTTTWTVPINPNEMSTPYASKRRQTMGNSGGPANRAGTIYTLQAPVVPHEWTFGGVIRTEDHHNQLLAWSQKNRPVRITDHFGRTWEVLIVQFDATDRRPTANNAWRMKYTMRTLMLGRVTA